MSRIRIVDEPFEGMQICAGMGKTQECIKCGLPIRDAYLARTVFGDGKKCVSHVKCASDLWDEIGTVCPEEYGPQDNPYRKYLP